MPSKIESPGKSVTVNVLPGDNPSNALQGLLNHAMNRTQTRSSADVPVDRTASQAFGGMQTKAQIEAGLRAKYGDRSRKRGSNQGDS